MPDWSPDGSQIVFHSSRDGENEIYVMSADGSGQVNLTNDPETDQSADWQTLQAPAPAPTMVAAPTATVAAAALPTTGATSDGTSGERTWLIAALLGSALSAAAGYGVLRIRSR